MAISRRCPQDTKLSHAWSPLALVAVRPVPLVIWANGSGVPSLAALSGAAAPRKRLVHGFLGCSRERVLGCCVLVHAPEQQENPLVVTHFCKHLPLANSLKFGGSPRPSPGCGATHGVPVPVLSPLLSSALQQHRRSAGEQGPGHRHPLPARRRPKILALRRALGRRGSVSAQSSAAPGGGAAGTAGSLPSSASPFVALGAPSLPFSSPHPTLSPGSASSAPSPVEPKPPPWQPPPSQPARCWRGSRARRWRRARRAVSQWEPAQRMWNLRANAATPRRQIKEDNILKKCPGGVVGASWLRCARSVAGRGVPGAPCGSGGSEPTERCRSRPAPAWLREK